MAGLGESLGRRRADLALVDFSSDLVYIFVEMANQTQISAYISKTTKSLVEEYADNHGVKKAHLVEEALLHHLQALRELPADLVIPPRVVVARDDGEVILERIERPRKPTKAMRELFKSK
jgi:hypothetical protein